MQSDNGMTPLRALLLADKKPGHYTLAEGILAAIARKRDVKVFRIDVHRPVWMPGRLLSSLVNRGLASEYILRSIYGIDPDLEQTDLIVSAGGNTLAANIAAARITGAKNIFYGSLRRYRPEDFSLVMTSYPSRAGLPHHFMTLKPSALDPDDIPPFQADTSQCDLPSSIGLIVGGNSGTISFRTADWDRLIGFINQCNRDYGTEFIVANAPRTPDIVSDRFASLLGTCEGPITSFLDIRQVGPGTLPQLLRQVPAVIVTADSSTMVSEAVWARRAVVSVAPQDFALPVQELEYRDWLADNNWVRQLPISELNPLKLQKALSGLAPLQRNPLDALAEQIEERLPDLFQA